MSAENPSIRTASTLVSTLIANGVKAVAYCPGSRNAPFAYALAQAESQDLLRVGTFSDERSASFWALGFIKGSGKLPCAVITTSGTAVAQLHAAMEEARHQELPLVAITADRPHHMRQVGASQTTLQEGIFGPSTVAEAAIPASADDSVAATSAVLNRLLLRATTEPGPVHLNVAFADPLTPATSEPLPAVKVPRRLEEPATYPRWDEVVLSGLGTIVIAGDQADADVLRAAAARGIPVLAEPSAGLEGATTWIPHAPLLLGHSKLTERIEQVIVTGHPTLSRPVTRLLASTKVRKVVCSERKIYPDLAGTADVIVPGLADSNPVEIPESVERNWLARWQQQAAQVEKVMAELADPTLNLVGVARLLWSHSPETALWLAASNAVRGVDVGATGQLRSNVFANRGLAGIDGTVASALGLATGWGSPVRALVGDLAFAADLSTLVQNPGTSADLQVLVLNDGGGSIFASLEHGGAPQPLYERYFAVAPTMNIANMTQGAGWGYAPVRTPDDLKSLLQTPVRGQSVGELFIPRPRALLEKIGNKVAEILR